ncbi:pre-mRNA-splicing factor 18, partial [Thraustotheca clavata]
APEDKEDEYDEEYDGNTTENVETDERTVYRFFKEMLGRWEEALANRPENVKRSAQGKIASRTMKQCKDYIRPLFRLCKSNSVPADILTNLSKLMLSNEKRFGPKFSTGKEEEPSPFAYTLPGTFEKSKCSKGTFSLAKRQERSPKPELESAYSPTLPGAFPNVFTADQLKIIETERRTRYNKYSHRQPKSKKIEIHIGNGPGSYHTDRDTNKMKIAVPCSFPKEKRLNIVQFASKRGWLSDSPGPIYHPKNNALASAAMDARYDSATLVQKAQARNDILMKEASKSLQATYKDFEKSFKRLNHSLSASAINSPHHGQINHPNDVKQSGPGSYNTNKTDFDVKCGQRGTFNTAKNLDLLSSLIAAGHAASTPTGPGDYDTQSCFDSKSFNTRGGYIPHKADYLKDIENLHIQVPSNTTRIFPLQHNHAPAKQVWKAMMKSPTPASLGLTEYILSLQFLH